MNLEKVVKYSVPLFVLAIVSRSIEEISFIYYAVPVMCVFYLVLMFISSRSNVQSHYKQENQETDIRYLPAGRQGPVSGIKRLSNIIHQPFTIFLLPSLWFLLTSLWSSYPDISAARALYFSLISLGCIAAGILWIKYSDKNILSFLLPANVIVVLISLFSLITNIPSDSWTGGHGKGFMGFFGHQNLLASVLLFTMPAVLHRIVMRAQSRLRNPTSDSRRTSFAGMTLKSDPSFRRSPESEIPSDYLLLTTYYLPLTAYYLLLTANLLLLILTYSRSSVLSLVIGAVLFLVISKNWKVLTYSLAITALLVLAFYFIPSFNQTIDKIIKKDFPEVYSSRMWMWEPSYNAALEGGLFGLGYGISHPDIRSGEYSDRFENGRLIREKGNSSLALIEEAGLIGLVLFLLPIIYLLRKLPDTRPCLPAGRYQIHDEKKLSGIRDMGTDIEKPVTSILIASLAALILHAQFEAWWVGVGSVQLPLFYLYIGLVMNRWNE